MSSKSTLIFCAILLCFLAAVQAQNTVRIPRTKFSCRGRPSGYYADLETGCQVYHMCDGLGRQFSYTCPNTTLFQQRMLICDHWYMVNCDTSESDYDANLLIGQRDKPFVSEAEMRLRTPRPDILSVPPNSNYFDGLKEAESKFLVHPSNSIVGVGDSIYSSNNNDLDSSKTQYRPPSSWSTGTGKRPKFPPKNVDLSESEDGDTLTGAASQKPTPTIQTNLENSSFGSNLNHVSPPSQDLTLPFGPATQASDEDFDIDARMKPVKADAVVTFIKRFDPNSPGTFTRTAMTTTEILDINQQLPQGQTSAEEDRTPRRQKNDANNRNTVQNDKRKGFTEQSRFDSINDKPTPTTPVFTVTEEAFKQENSGIPTPSRELLPPKEEYSNAPTTTVGPPIYYEWKWAVPAFGLEPPKKSNVTANETEVNPRVGRNPFVDVTRPTPTTVEVTPSNTEYNISSYFVPDYIFPLDSPHPGYEDQGSRTSFQVEAKSKGYGENPQCPHCHPAYLKPGSCEPCIVKR